MKHLFIILNTASFHKFSLLSNNIMKQKSAGLIQMSSCPKDIDLLSENIFIHKIFMTLIYFFQNGKFPCVLKSLLTFSFTFSEFVC